MKYLPTNSELEVLNIIWDQQPCTVRQIHDLLTESKNTGYTTTLKIVQNLFEAGTLERKPEGKTHLYSAKLAREEVQTSFLDKFVGKLFEGSSKKLILQALGSQKTSPEELREIKELIENMSKK